MTRLRITDLSDVQAEALERLEPRRWLGTRETDVQGSTITALAHKGLVRRAWTKRPHKRIVARLTPDGVRAREERRRRRLQRSAIADLDVNELIARWVLDADERPQHAEAVLAELQERARRRARDEDERTIATLAVLYLEREGEGTEGANGRLPELTLHELAGLVLEREPSDEDLERVHRALTTAETIGRIIERGGHGWRLAIPRGRR